MIVLAAMAAFWLVGNAIFWTRVILQIIGPTNWIDTYIHTRHGMKWGLLICWPLSAACGWGFHLIDQSMTPGAPVDGRILFLCLLLGYDALKLFRMGIVSVVLLIRARITEYLAARRARRARLEWQEQYGAIDTPPER